MLEGSGEGGSGVKERKSHSDQRRGMQQTKARIDADGQAEQSRALQSREKQTEQITTPSNGVVSQRDALDVHHVSSEQ